MQNKLSHLGETAHSKTVFRIGHDMPIPSKVHTCVTFCSNYSNLWCGRGPPGGL